MKNKYIINAVLLSVVIVLLFQSVQGITHSFVLAESKDQSTYWPITPDMIVPDDYATIQEAIDHAFVGCCIGIRMGTYHENIDIIGRSYDNLVLMGEDAEYTIITADHRSGVDTININDANNIVISHLTITGSGQEYDPNSLRFLNQGINCTFGQNIVIQDNIIKDNGNGVTCKSCTLVTIENSTIIDNLDDGIDGNAQFSINYCNISNNGHGLPSDITNGDGIEIMSSAYPSEITNNIISYNGVDGIWDETVDDHIILDNIIHHNGQAGIHLEEGRDCKIRNNQIYSNGLGNFGRSGAGILFIQSTSNLIDNNEIYNNKRGIHFRQSHYNEISDNKIYNNKNFGIQLDQTSGSQIFNNQIYENLIGIQLNFATGFRISYNDIYLNNLYGMISALSIGSATFNWWGNMFGPYMVKMLRLPPLITIVTPWSPFRINNEGDDF